MLVTYSIEYIRLFDNTISVVYDAYCHRKPTIQKKKKEMFWLADICLMNNILLNLLSMV